MKVVDKIIALEEGKEAENIPLANLSTCSFISEIILSFSMEKNFWFAEGFLTREMYLSEFSIPFITYKAFNQQI